MASATRKTAKPKIANDERVTAHELEMEELEHERYGETGIDENGTIGRY